MKVVKEHSEAVGNIAAVEHNQTPLDLRSKRIVLMLQGGGALGAYQVGALEALARECAAVKNKIDWVAGISIGAINSAVIAAPKSGDAVRELELLWDEILSPFDYTDLINALLPSSQQPWFAVMAAKYADWNWMAFNPWGQANFFSSRVLDPFRNPWVQQWFHMLRRNELGFYGTGELARMLDRHVDWDALKGRSNTRLSLGATHVCDGEVKFFHSWDGPLEAKHVQASGALPPAFPPVQIDNEWYLDGGVSNNTPIEVLGDLLHASDTETLVFLVDLWDRKDDVLPRSFEDLLWRQKSIQYGSRKKAAEIVVERYEYRAAKRQQKKPAKRLEVCQVMLEHPENEPQFSFADADFSRSTFCELRAQGFKDMMAAIRHSELVIDKQTQLPVGGEHAMLYRHGSLGKWKADRDRRHEHRPTKRMDVLPSLEPLLSWWKQITPGWSDHK
jgi:NTE family protein